MYGWIVDWQNVEVFDEELPVAIFGGSDIPQEYIDRLEQGEGLEFIMRDDDGIIYYEGRIIVPRGRDDLLFAPLDDYGAPNAGCTSIEYDLLGIGEFEPL